jgi:apolipoprotein N-acyltransferase
LSLLILAYPICLVQLLRASTSRQSFYLGFSVGLFNAGYQLICFWTIFSVSAVALWCILAFWTGLFVALGHICLVRLGKIVACLLVPLFWTGLEYFRSELYYLRFSWLNTGYALAQNQLPAIFRLVGNYGVGFLAMAAAVVFTFCFQGRRTFSFILLGPMALFVVLLSVQPFSFAGSTFPVSAIEVAGIQLEFAIGAEVVAGLDKILRQRPETQLLILSEYTFDGEVPENIRAWCRKNRRYLIAGGKDPAPGKNFYNTAFVIDPEGQIVFRQVKSVPIQFFKDGLPAPEQRIWNSPWGKIGLCICYDLSYTRITDKLIRLGAQAIIVPTMDIMDWGRRQHELHARVAPVRAAEYGVPIFRVASSGISQCTDSLGHVIAKAGFPGQGEIIFGRIELPKRGGSIPLDRWLDPFALAITVAFMAWQFVTRYSLPSRLLPKSPGWYKSHMA